jgi:hypothetical protein
VLSRLARVARFEARAQQRKLPRGLNELPQIDFTTAEAGAIARGASKACWRVKRWTLRTIARLDLGRSSASKRPSAAPSRWQERRS